MAKAYERFQEFHGANPHVYANIVRMARQAKDRGRNKIGMPMLFEVMRWNHILKTDSKDEFKLNNDYIPFYSRLVMKDNPDLEGMFEIRTSVADKHIAGRNVQPAVNPNRPVFGDNDWIRAKKGGK